MNIPLLISKLSDLEINNFYNNHANTYVNDKQLFLIENLWFRTQEKSNQKYSGWKTHNDKRRRVIHSMQYYDVCKESKSLYLDKVYIYLSLTLPKTEIEEFLNDTLEHAENQRWIISKEDQYSLKFEKDNLKINIIKHSKHPVDEKEGRHFPSEYEHVELFIYDKKTVISENKDDYDRIWTLFRRGLRPHGLYGNPINVTRNIESISHLFPAQIEVGCGPSIESNIPALDSLHEVFRVQNKFTHEFYWGKHDNFVKDIVCNSAEKFIECAEMPLKIIKAMPSKTHKIISDLIKEGLIVSPVLSNNFDKLFEKAGCKEILVRKYSYDEFYPKIEFNSKAKSLLVIGCHADRRQIQLQARQLGLKIIYINPEGYTDGVTVREKKVESLKEGDYIIRLTASEAMELIENLLQPVLNN
jgi:hypothetical protein